MAELKNGTIQHLLTEEEARKGGLESVKVRKRKKDLKECLNILLDTEIEDKHGTKKTGAEILAIKAFQEAMKGNTKFWELVRDTSGQKPIEKVAVAEVTAQEINEVEDLVKRAKKDLETHEKE